MNNRMKVLQRNVRERRNLVIVVPRSPCPNLNGALGRSVSADARFDGSLERSDDVATEAGGLLREFEARGGRGGRGVEGGGGGRGERVGLEEGGGEGEEEEEAGGRELQSRGEEVGVRGVEETLEGCRGGK